MLFRTMVMTAAFAALTACNAPPSPGESLIGTPFTLPGGEPGFIFVDGRRCANGTCIVIDKAARTIQIGGQTVLMPDELDTSKSLISFAEATQLSKLVEARRLRAEQQSNNDGESGSDGGGEGGGGGGLD